MKTPEERESALKELFGKKIVGIGLINDVPAVKLDDGTTIWIENAVKNGKTLI